MRGFTTVRDTAGADRGHKMAVEDGLFTGPRLFVSGRGISQTGGHGDMRTRIDHPDPCGCFHMLNGQTGGMGRVADGVPDVRRAVRDEIRLGAEVDWIGRRADAARGSGNSLAARGVAVPGIAGNSARHCSSGTSVPSATVGWRLGGGGVPSVAHRSSASSMARKSIEVATTTPVPARPPPRST